MSASQRPRLAELKVGIFVIITCTILAAAIFAIGYQVGLFQEKFWAMTYLSNVSGLKPGDIVLLNGIEVGNVMNVDIGQPGRILDTAQNQRARREIEQLEARASENSESLQAAAERVAELEQRLEELQQADADPDAIEGLEEELFAAKRRVTAWDEQVVRDERNLERAYGSLQNIEVLMRISSEYRDWVSADSKISLGSIGLLGDKYIEISLGRSTGLSQVVQRREEHWWGTDTKDIVLITGTPQASFGEIITGANDVLANVENLSSKLDQIMSTFGTEEGSVGKFINDPSFYNNLDSAVAGFTSTLNEIAELINRIDGGEGSLSRLIHDEEMYTNLNDSVVSLEELLVQLKEGEGSFSSFVNDPVVFEKTSEMLEKVNLIADDIRTGKGTLGQLATDDELYNTARESLKKLDGLLGEIEQGHGTLGRLAQNEELYDNLNTLTSELVKFMYDFRQDPKKFLTINFRLF